VGGTGQQRNQLHGAQLNVHREVFATFRPPPGSPESNLIEQMGFVVTKCDNTETETGSWFKALPDFF
jgi:hypothetical protein